MTTRKKRQPKYDICDEFSAFNIKYMQSLANGSSGHHKNLQGISQYNSIAARRIQACFRGFICRVKLWSYGGALMISCVKKIQRIWRGHHGRRKALIIYKKFLTNMANRLIGLYREWKSRRFLKTLRATRIKKLVTRIQCLYRTRLARALVKKLRRIFRNKMATFIQKHTRKYLGYRRYGGVDGRLKGYIHHMIQFRKEIIVEAANGRKLTIENIRTYDLRQLFNSVFCHLFNTFRNELAVDIATVMCQMYPTCKLNVFVMQLSLMSAWACYGRAKLLREDFLEEAVQLIYWDIQQPKDLPQMEDPTAVDTVPVSEREEEVQQEMESEGLIPVTWGRMWGDRYKNLLTGESVDPVTCLREGLVEELELIMFHSGVALNRRISGNLVMMGTFVALGVANECFGTGFRPPRVKAAPGSAKPGNKGRSSRRLMRSGDWGTPTRSRTSSRDFEGPTASGRRSPPSPTGPLGGRPLFAPAVSSPLAPSTAGAGAEASGLAEGMNESNQYKGSCEGEGDRDESVDPLPSLQRMQVTVEEKEEEEAIDYGASLPQRQPQVAAMSSKTPLAFRAAMNTMGMGMVAAADTGTAVDAGTPTPVLQHQLYIDEADVPVSYASKDRHLVKVKEQRRMKEFLREAKKRATAAELEQMSLRQAVGNSLWGSAHAVVAAQRTTFDDCLLTKYIFHSAAHTTAPLSGMGMGVTADVDVVMAGEMLIIRGRVLAKAHVASDHVSIKWRSGADGRGDIVDLSRLAVKPVVLLPKEVNYLMSFVLHRADDGPSVGTPGPSTGSATKGGSFSVEEAARVAKEAEEAEEAYKFSKSNSIKKLAAYLLETVKLTSYSSRTSILTAAAASESRVSSRPPSSAPSSSSSRRQKPSNDDLDSPACPEYPSAGHTAGFRLVLPCVEYLRRERNCGRMEEYATRVLQKAYRGFVGRARYRRLVARGLEKKRQDQVLARRCAYLHKVRLRRFWLVAMIQSRVRGALVRIMIALWNRCALLVQKRYRIVLAKRIAQEERMRRLMGPPVLEVIRKGICIGDRTIMVTIHRCGTNYRVTGQDVINKCVYEAFIYRQEIEEMLDKHNANIIGETLAARQDRIKLWHYDRVCELMLTKLKLIRRITPATNDLGGGKTDTNLELVISERKAGADIRNINDAKHQRRLLSDERDTLLRFEKMMAVKTKMRAAAAEAEKKEKAKALAATVAALGAAPPSRMTTKGTASTSSTGSIGTTNKVKNKRA